MPSLYQKKSFNALMGLFLDSQGYALPQHPSRKDSLLKVLIDLTSLERRHIHRLFKLNDDRFALVGFMVCHL